MVLCDHSKPRKSEERQLYYDGLWVHNKQWYLDSYARAAHADAGLWLYSRLKGR